MHGGHQRDERGGGPAEERDERPREVRSRRSRRCSRTSTPPRSAVARERDERAGEEDREQQERDADELALESCAAHADYRSRSGPSLVICRSW